MLQWLRTMLFGKKEATAREPVVPQDRPIRPRAVRIPKPLTHTQALLGEGTEIMIRTGPDDPELISFIDANPDDLEFQRLMQLARELKRSMQRPTV